MPGRLKGAREVQTRIYIDLEYKTYRHLAQRCDARMLVPKTNYSITVYRLER
jgi:hypothetical protein